MFSVRVNLLSSRSGPSRRNSFLNTPCAKDLFRVWQQGVRYGDPRVCIPVRFGPPSKERNALGKRSTTFLGRHGVQGEPATSKHHGNSRKHCPTSLWNHVRSFFLSHGQTNDVLIGSWIALSAGVLCNGAKSSLIFQSKLSRFGEKKNPLTRCSTNFLAASVLNELPGHVDSRRGSEVRASTCQKWQHRKAAKWIGSQTPAAARMIFLQIVASWYQMSMPMRAHGLCLEEGI